MLALDDFEGRLWLMETETGTTRLLATGVTKPGAAHAHPSFDRQGRYVLFNCARNGRQSVALIDLR